MSQTSTLQHFLSVNSCVLATCFIIHVCLDSMPCSASSAKQKVKLSTTLFCFYYSCKPTVSLEKHINTTIKYISDKAFLSAAKSSFICLNVDITYDVWLLKLTVYCKIDFNTASAIMYIDVMFDKGRSGKYVCVCERERE